MKKIQHNQRGFGTLETILIVVVVAILGAAAWYVYKNHNKTSVAPVSTSSTPTTPTPQPQSPSPAPSVHYTAFVNELQPDGKIVQVTPNKIAKTPDEIGVLVALHASCTAPDDYVFVGQTAFNDNVNYKQDGGYAKLNATACTKKASTRDEIAGSGADNFLHKLTSGSWQLDFSSQEILPCSKVDGLGYPKSIIAMCYVGDGSTTRAPK